VPDSRDEVEKDRAVGHPGPGVTFLPGYNCAQEVLEKEFHWREPDRRCAIPDRRAPAAWSGMEFHDGLVLGSRAARALGRLAVDRLAEELGHALPRTPEQLARPEVVNHLLRNHTPAGETPLPPVRGVRLPGVAFESSNCQNFLIEIEFDANAPDEKALPGTAYVKLPCAELATRAFANAVGFWEVEAAFCERIASRVPIRVPRVYAVARRGSRFVLLLEDLRALPGIRLFLNRDMAAGTSAERARMCLRTFAELHAAFWGWTQEQRDHLVPARLHTYLGPGGREMTRALNVAAIAPAHRAAPDVFTKDHASLFRQATEKWDRLIETWYDGPLTLVHGDSHLANCFEYDSPDGPRMGMLDFQGMHWCKGIRDVQYFLINSLEPELLTRHEGELIDTYVAALADRGVALDPEAARDQYRAFSFQTLMVAVTSIGLGSLTERDATVRTVLRRSVAAIDRLGFGDWLEDL
jgi:aminoglycoside/choline kinase family phosphotransferase